jgi:hypothetical protein
MASGVGIVAPPKLLPPISDSTTDDWQVNEHIVTTIGVAGVSYKVHSLLLDITALVGTLTVRLYTDVNGVQVQSYMQNLSLAVDGPGLWIVNGTLAIYGTLLCTVVSDNALDNGQPIGWEYILEST